MREPAGGAAADLRARTRAPRRVAVLGREPLRPLALPGDRPASVSAPGPHAPAHHPLGARRPRGGRGRLPRDVRIPGPAPEREGEPDHEARHGAGGGRAGRPVVRRAAATCVTTCRSANSASPSRPGAGSRRDADPQGTTEVRARSGGQACGCIARVSLGPAGSTSLDRRAFVDHLERTGSAATRQRERRGPRPLSDPLEPLRAVRPLPRGPLGVRGERLAYEYWGHEASILPISHLPLGRRRMRRFLPRAGRDRKWWSRYATSTGSKRRVLRRLRAEGPLESADFAPQPAERGEKTESLRLAAARGQAVAEAPVARRPGRRERAAPLPVHL